MQEGRPRTKVLVSAKVRPAAAVEAKGAVTLGAGQITVATLVFTFPDGFTLSPKITDGKVVKALGSSAVAGGPIVLKKVKRNSHHGRSARHTAQATASAEIAGRVSGLTPPRRRRRARSWSAASRSSSRPARCSAPKVADGAFVARQRQGQGRRSDPEEGQGQEPGRYARRLAPPDTADRPGGGSAEPPPDVVLDRLQSRPMQRATHADWLTPPANRWAFRHVRELIPTARIRRGSTVRELAPAPVDGLLDLEFAGTDGVTRTLGPYLEESYHRRARRAARRSGRGRVAAPRRRRRRAAHRDEHLEVDHRAAGRRARGRRPARSRGAGRRATSPSRRAPRSATRPSATCST